MDDHFPNLNLDVLKAGAAFWAERYPQISSVSLHRYIPSQDPFIEITETFTLPYEKLERPGMKDMEFPGGRYSQEKKIPIPAGKDYVLCVEVDEDFETSAIEGRFYEDFLAVQMLKESPGSLNYKNCDVEIMNHDTELPEYVSRVAMIRLFPDRPWQAEVSPNDAPPVAMEPKESNNFFTRENGDYWHIGFKIKLKNSQRISNIGSRSGNSH